MEGGRFAPNVFEAVTLVHLLPERAIFLLQFATLHGTGNQQFDFVQIKRLGDKIVCAAFHRFDRDVDRAVCRHHDADGSAWHFQSAIDQLHSIFSTEAQIGEKHVDLLPLEDVHRAGNIRSDIHVVFVFKQTPQSVARMLFIIDDQDSGLNEVHVENAAILHRPAHSDFEKCFFSSETGMTRNLPALTSRFVNVCSENRYLPHSDTSRPVTRPDHRSSELRRGLAEFDAASPINNIFGRRWIA